MTATLWQHPAVYCTPENDGAEVAAWMRRFGFRLAVQKISEGMQAEVTADEWSRWARPIRQEGFLAGAWSVHHLQPKREADLVYGVYAAGAKFDCLLLDCEDDYCYTGPYGADHTEQRNTVLRRGIDLFKRTRAHFPALPIGWNPLGNPGKDYGAVSDGPLNQHQAARVMQMRLVPQCYPRQPGDDGFSQAKYAIDRFVDTHHWPRSLIHPAVDAWLELDGSYIAAELAQARTVGFFAFRYGLINDDTARLLGSTREIGL